jgi:predicted Zn-dependent protease
MSGMRTRTLLSVLISAASLSACALRGPLPPGAPPSGPSPSGTAQPAPPPPDRPSAPPPRQFHLGPAASALVTQAHTQAGGGDYGQAAATLERALRIEPDNPLLWIELGRVRLDENNAAQADAMGRKALALATADAGAQAAAWRLIADSLRSLGRNPEAAEADERAGTLAPR